MRRSSLLFLIFAAILILSQLALPLFLKSASYKSVGSSTTHRIELNADSKISVVKSECDGLSLKVEIDSSRPSPMVETDNDNIEIQYVDSTSTLIVHCTEPTKKKLELTLTLPSQTLNIVSGLTNGNLVIGQIEVPNLILSPTPANIVMGEAKIDTLILAAVPADYESVTLVAGSSYIGDLITTIPPENIQLTLGHSRIGSITQVADTD